MTGRFFPARDGVWLRWTLAALVVTAVPLAALGANRMVISEEFTGTT
jgi:hypothetical protein